MLNKKFEINSKINDIDYFLNECKKCNLKFDDNKKLLNHVNNFCIDSKFGNVDELEKKFEKNLNYIEKNNQNEDLMNIFKINQNDDYSILIKKLREMEINEDLDNLKSERNKIRLEKIDEENLYQKRLEEFQRKKREEIEAYIEKQKIKKKLKGLEKEKIELLEKEKKIELEKIERQKEKLFELENGIKLEVKRLQKEIEDVNDWYKEEENKINNLGDNIKKYSDINNYPKKYYKEHYENKIEKVSNLRAKRLEYENKKKMIDKNIEELKWVKNLGDYKYKNLGLVNYQLQNEIVINKENNYKKNQIKDSLDNLVNNHNDHYLKDELENKQLANLIKQSIKENEYLKTEIREYNKKHTNLL